MEALNFYEIEKQRIMYAFGAEGFIYELILYIFLVVSCLN